MSSENDDTQRLDQESPVRDGAELEQLSPEEQVVLLRRNLEEVRQEVEQNKDLAQRAQAELVNFRKRSDEERLTLQQQANSRLFIKILPVFDELDLAVNHADQNVAGDSWVEGVRLIQRKCASLLESEGVSRIDAVGVPFDPLHHEAVGTEESTQHPPGYVVEVVRNGYLLHDRLLQPAQVVVAK